MPTTTQKGARGPVPRAFNEQNSAGQGPLFEARRALGLSRPAMAQILGMSPRGIQDAEGRGSVPTGDASDKLLALVVELPDDKLTPELKEFIAMQKARYEQLAAIFGEGK